LNWWARSACRWPNPRSSTLPESTCWRLSASTGPGRRTGAFASAAGGLLSGPIGAARSPCIKRRTSAISMKVSAFSNWPELATAVRETGAERKTAPSEFCTIELDLGGRRAFRHLDLIVEATTPGPAGSPGGGGNPSDCPNWWSREDLEANEFVSDIHDRMPVILEAEHFEQWMAGDANDAAARMKPAGDALLQKWPVSRRVNSSRADHSDGTLIEKIEVPT
jgi:hypothetical protein